MLRQDLVEDVMKAYDYKITKEQAIDVVFAFLEKEYEQHQVISKTIWKDFTGFPDGFPYFDTDE